MQRHWKRMMVELTATLRYGCLMTSFICMLLVAIAASSPTSARGAAPGPAGEDEERQRLVQELEAEASRAERELRKVAAANATVEGFKLSETPEYKAWTKLKSNIAELRLGAAAKGPVIYEVYDPALATGLAVASWLVPAGLGALVIAADSDSDDLVTLGIVIIGVGAVIGPSAGHLYSGDLLRGLGFSGIRLAIYGLGGGAILGAAQGGDAGATIAIGGVAAVAGLTLSIWDLVDAGPSADRANVALAKERASKVSLTATPMLLTARGTGRTSNLRESVLGFGAAGRF